MMMSSTLEMPLTPTTPVAVDWGVVGPHGGGQLHVVTFTQVWAMQHPRRRRVEPRTAALSRVWR